MKYALVALFFSSLMGLGYEALAVSATPLTGQIRLKGEIKPNCQVTINGKDTETLTYTRGAGVSGLPVVLGAECNKYGSYKIKITVPKEFTSLKTEGAVPLILRREDNRVIGTVPGDDLLEAIDRKITETLFLDFTEADAKVDAPVGDDYTAIIRFEIVTGN